jgi:hypothetical protein
MFEHVGKIAGVEDVTIIHASAVDIGGQTLTDSR